MTDIDNDGFPEIILPPPRKADKDSKTFFIFKWNKECWQRLPVCLSKKEKETLDYGTVDLGDINGDGIPDIGIAIHKEGVHLFLSKKEDACWALKRDNTFQSPPDFLSRTLVLDDINNDNKLEIIAAAEADTKGKIPPKGIMIASKDQKNWKYTFIKEANGLFADDIEIADLDQNGQKDIIWAPLVGHDGYRRVVFWGPNFKEYLEISEIIPDEIPFRIEVDGRKSTIWLSSGAISQRKERLFFLNEIKIEQKRAILKRKIPLKALARDIILLDINDDGVADPIISQGDGLYYLLGSKLRKFWDSNLKGLYFMEKYPISQEKYLILIGKGKESTPEGLQVLYIKINKNLQGGSK